MKLKNKLFLYLILFILGGMSPAFAAFGSQIEVTELADMNSFGAAGYLFCGNTITNTTSKKITVEIKLWPTDYSYQLTTYKKIELAPHESKEEYIYCPNKYGTSNNTYKIGFYVNGELEHTSNVHSIGSSYSRPKTILLDKKISNLEIEKLIKADGKRYGSDRFESVYYPNNIEFMPTNWVAYSQYEFLMYYDSTYESMPAAVKNVILEYVRAGGKLIIVGQIDIPDDCRYTSNDPEAGMEMKCRVGFGGIMLLRKNFFNELVVDEKKQDNNYNSYNSSNKYKKQSFGKDSAEEKNKKPTFTLKTDFGKTIKATNALSAVKNFLDYDRDRFSGNEYRKFDTISEFRSKYEQMSSRSVLGVLIIIFAIILGPLNYYILKKKDKRILVFITTPIIALVCCILIFGYNLIFEAWRFDIFRQSITILYQNDNSAITNGCELFISGSNMNKPLEYPLGTVINPCTDYPGFDIGKTIERVVRLENVQKLTENWIKAKAPLALVTASVKQSRARLEIKKTNDGIEILNGLGADIKNAYVASEDGKRIYSFNGIKAGAIGTAQYTSAAKNYKKNFDGIRVDYDYITKNAKSIIKPGEYIAFLNSDPFMAQDVDSKAKIHELGCVVIGINDSEKTK